MDNGDQRGVGDASTLEGRRSKRDPYPFSESAATPNAQVAQRLQRFKRDLGQMSTQDVTRKHLTMGQGYLLDADEQYTLVSAVGEHFSCHPNNIKIVGSAQLGFSIAPNKRYRPFHEGSDIDVAVISDRAFDEIWMSACDYHSADKTRWGNVNMFRKYLMSGWIRPDALPNQDFPRLGRRLEFMGSLNSRTKDGAFRLSAGLYRSHEFLEAYQQRAVDGCKRELELNK